MKAVAVPVDGFSGRLSPGRLAPDVEAAAEIAAHWSTAKARKPDIFDGRVLLAADVSLEGRRLQADFRETGYSTYLWLKAEGRERYPVANVFSAAAVVSSDGAVLLGRMAPHTATAGQVYFPCGTPDLDDVAGDVVDLEGSLLRELAEETGLGPDDVSPSETRIVVIDGPLYGCIRRLDARFDAAALRSRAEGHFAGQVPSELDAAILVRTAAELTEASPPYVHAAVAALVG